MALELNGKKEKMHSFQVPTPHGMGVMQVPESAMRACKCGCSVFEQRWKVGYAKQEGVLNAPVMLLKVEIFVCPKCGEEIGPESPTVGEVQKGRLLQ